VLSDLVIVNFQSVKTAQLQLGRFTVITGPTGSGKSAAVRAIHLAAFNKRGSDFITRGAKEPCRVVIASADEGKGWAARIERGKTSSKDSYTMNYVVDTPVKDGVGVSGAKYTKLGGQVPPQVTEYLRITELCFARQFDRPYLLDESGGQVARVLGDLTNVTTVFEAAREGERLRRVHAAALRTADKDLDSITEQLQQYVMLPYHRTAINAAEQELATAAVISDRLRRVQELRSSLQSARAELSAQQAAVPSPPSLEAAEALATRLKLLRDLRDEVQQTAKAAGAAANAATLAGHQAQAAHKKLHDSLVKAGKCPMCGQQVTEWSGLASIVTE
jgi:DNA repair exonuclease SbcCD ATPase subunit